MLRTFILVLRIIGFRDEIAMLQASNEKLVLLDTASVERAKRLTVSCCCTADEREQWHFLVELLIKFNESA